MITYEGGRGTTAKEAIMIKGARNTLDGVWAEYQYLEDLYGIRDKDWKLELQELCNIEGRSYDILSIILKSGEKKLVWFDITEFRGR